MNLDDAVTAAMHRIEELYYETGGKCYVSFSGGKDSTVLLALIKMCEEIYTIPEGAIPAVFSNTGVELGITYDFVKWVRDNWYSNVQIIRPNVSFDWVIKNEGKPIKSKMRAEYIGRWQSGNHGRSVTKYLIEGVSNNGLRARKTKLADRDMHLIHEDISIRFSNKCCHYLKKKPFAKYADDNGIRGCMVGIRMEEGGARNLNAHLRERTNGKVCTSIDKKGFIKKYPIIDWTNAHVEEFIKKYNVPLSKAYTEYGFERTGCMACPFNPRVGGDLKYLYYHEAPRYKAAMHWLKDVFIAQNVILPFDEKYEEERKYKWRTVYEPMRQEMLRKYRPDSRLIKEDEQTDIFEYLYDGKK